jgi:hypothetical protein
MIAAGTADPGWADRSGYAPDWLEGFSNPAAQAYSAGIVGTGIYPVYGISGITTAMRAGWIPGADSGYLYETRAAYSQAQSERYGGERPGGSGFYQTPLTRQEAPPLKPPDMRSIRTYTMPIKQVTMSDTATQTVRIINEMKKSRVIMPGKLDRMAAGRLAGDLYTPLADVINDRKNRK